MDNQTAIYMGVATCVIAFLAFLVAYWQMEIASAKLRLELYNKRFAIYIAAIEYYQAAMNDNYPEMKRVAQKFIHAFRESKFLFDPKDNVYSTLVEIKNCGAAILLFEKKVFEESIGEIDRINEDIVNNAISARSEFGKNLQSLEDALKKYIQFNSKEGW